jgi:hypothetical protein
MGALKLLSEPTWRSNLPSDPLSALSQIGDEFTRRTQGWAAGHAVDSYEDLFSLYALVLAYLQQGSVQTPGSVGLTGVRDVDGPNIKDWLVSFFHSVGQQAKRQSIAQRLAAQESFFADQLRTGRYEAWGVYRQRMQELIAQFRQEIENSPISPDFKKRLREALDDLLGELDAVAPNQERVSNWVTTIIGYVMSAGERGKALVKPAFYLLYLYVSYKAVNQGLPPPESPNDLLPGPSQAQIEHKPK